jgi:hypothetical protein
MAALPGQTQSILNLLDYSHLQKEKRDIGGHGRLKIRVICGFERELKPVVVAVLGTRYTMMTII